MELFPELDKESNARDLRFLVIGGLAINYYGYSRDTADLDLLICKEKRAEWLQIFSLFGYTVDQDSDSFIQFSPPQEGDWPVDLMLVREPTFHLMWTDSQAVRMFDVQMRLPSLEHLIALKLHACGMAVPTDFSRIFKTWKD